MMEKICKKAVLMLISFHILDATTQSKPDLTVPEAGNCGDDVILSCKSSLNSYRGWVKKHSNGSIVALMQNGNIILQDKYLERIKHDNSSFDLVIKNLTMADSVYYACKGQFLESPFKFLQYECKARSANVSVTGSKQLSFVIQKIFPKIAGDGIKVTVTVNGSTTLTIPGSIDEPLPNADEHSHYDVSWKSSQTLKDGSYRFSIVVTTVTDSDPLTGNFTIVAPSTPVIETTDSINGENVVWAIEDEESVLKCVSSGGYPQTYLVWLKGSSNTPLGDLLPPHLENDGTYTLTIELKIRPARETDRKVYKCKSYYDVTDDRALISIARLYLKLKPSLPTISDADAVTAGTTFSAKCTTFHARPAANISWLYDSNYSSPSVRQDKDQTTLTFTSTSEFRQNVQRQDNGQPIKCIISHETLRSTLSASTNMTVKFPPLSTSLMDNTQIIANGTNELILRCVTDTAFPAANVKWSTRTKEFNTGVRQAHSPGAFSGTITTGYLTLKPTRDLDGDLIWCSASNSANENTPVKDSTKLDLLYSPLVRINDTSPKTVTENESIVVLHCYASSKPQSTFTWYHDSNLLPSKESKQIGSEARLTIAGVNRTHYGEYRCEANNSISPNGQASLRLHVEFRPLAVRCNLTGKQIIERNYENVLQLVCETDTSNPASQIIWKNGSVHIPNSSPVNESNGQYGGKVTTQTLRIVPTRFMDGNKIVCQGSNKLSGNRPANNTTTLDLDYYPITKVEERPTKIVIEGQLNQNLTCTADSKPAATFVWYKDSDMVPLMTGDGTQIKNQLVYSIDVVNRSHAGDYSCTADNGIRYPDNSNGNIQLVVHYPPSVTVRTTNTSVNATNVEIICNADGFPKRCTFSKWKHSWAGANKTIRTEMSYLVTETPTQQILNITSPSYQDTGIYTCGASNGVIRWGANTDQMTNTVYLLVKSFPIVTSEEHEKGNVKITPGLNKHFNFSVPFYSNADNTNAVLNRIINATGESNTTYERVNNASLDIKDAEVELTVYGRAIRTPGYRLTLTHTFYDFSEYGLYCLKIQNEIGTKEVFFNAIPESAPCMLISPAIDAVIDSAITVSWVPCFHGGFAQTFVIQYKEAGYLWVNGSTKEGGLSTNKKRINSTISNLQPATTYYIRMFAFNEIGRSVFTETLNTTTTKRPEDPPTSPNVGLIAGGAAGGVALAVITVVLILLFLRRRQGHLKSPNKSLLKDNESSSGTKGTEDTPEINLNPMYEPAGPLPSTSNNSDVYSQVDKTRRTTQPVGDIYSQVDKPKKRQKFGGSEVKNDVYAQVQKNTQKKKDAGKLKQQKQKPAKKTKRDKKAEAGNIYDNVDTVNSTVTKGDTVYENPSCSIEDEHPKQMRNQDGLIYADLDLPKETVGIDRKAIIHGLDDRTDYADINYGEVGKQAQESDEEKKQE